MPTQNLTDANGKLIGRMETTGQQVRLTDANGRLLGYYDITSDKTSDESGQMVGRGNLLPILLELEKR